MLFPIAVVVIVAKKVVSVVYEEVFVGFCTWLVHHFMIKQLFHGGQLS
jgi:hypothetical protein